MKRIMIFLLILICTALPAQAEDTPDQAVLTLIQAEYPNCTIGQADQWGDTAAVALEHDGKKILCIMESQNGQWRMTVNSSTILLPDEDLPTSLYLDTDETLFWTYLGLNDCSFHFHAAREQDGYWYFKDEIMQQQVELDETARGIRETMMTWSDRLGSCLIVTESEQDENENLIYQKEPLYFPAAWLMEKTDLRFFNICELPFLMEIEYPGQWPEYTYLQAAAAQLMPSYTYRDGAMSGNTLQFLMDKPDGTRVLAVYDLTGQREMTESSALPKDTYYGVENFTTSLGVNGLCVTIENYGTNGVTYLDGYMNRAESLRIGPMVVGGNEGYDHLLYFGKHPWRDIRYINWNSLPINREEAAKAMDTSGYALVDNPDPKDRLHLRERPDGGSKSVGKYYSGTPVVIHGIRGDWAEVTVLDSGFVQTGYMMKKYLDFSGRLVIDLDIMPDWHFRSGAILYGWTDENSYRQPVISQYEWKVVGIIGDDWVHVWNPWTGEAGFARVADEMPGNG